MEEWIGVDLDGTLAEYKEWKAPDYIGPPIPKRVARVKKWVKEGKRVKIFTARVSPATAALNGITVVMCRRVIEDWLSKHLGYILEITNEKDHALIELWDDLDLVQVNKNTGMPKYII